MEKGKGKGKRGGFVKLTKIIDCFHEQNKCYAFKMASCALLPQRNICSLNGQVKYINSRAMQMITKFPEMCNSCRKN